MIVQNQHLRVLINVNPDIVVRRTILFVAVILSGGLLIFDRTILAAAMLAMSIGLMINSPIRLKRSRWVLLLSWLLLVYVVTFIRPLPIEVAATITRTVNFTLALLLLWIYTSQPPNTLKNDLLFILEPMAWQAIGTVIIAAIAPSLFLPININGGTYYTILLLLTFHHTLDGGGIFVRPDGFFFEPGVLQIYLNIYLHLILISNRSRIRIGIAVLAVFLTQSTTGLIVASIIVGAHLFRAAVARVSIQRYLFVFGIAIIFVPASIYVFNNVQQKLFGELAGSATARQYDLLMGLTAIMQNPWTGIGFGDREYFRISSELSDATAILAEIDAEGRSTTNGIINALYALGVPLGALLIVSLFNQKVLPGRILFGMVIAIGLFGEALIFTPFFLFFAFSGMTSKGKPNVSPVPTA